ncbi:MAG TPA: S-layer homology domain-containing protein [Acidimicrobiales bacterium]|nr:S-layer homology domain-containing protein [Acidimicrobiales bacterium]
MLAGLFAALLALGLLPATAGASHGADHNEARLIDRACPPGSSEGDEFVDTAGSTFRDEINCVASYGIAQGGPGNLSAEFYGPSLRVSRGQMASFIMRKLDLVTGYARPATDGDAFPDIAQDTHRANINDAAAEEIALGFADGTFRPGNDVTRGEMASFIVREMQTAGATLPTEPADAFPDAEGSAHHQPMNILHELGIYVGRTDGSSGFAEPIIREQMAALLARNLAFLVEEGLVAPIVRSGITLDATTVEAANPFSGVVHGVEIASLGVAGDCVEDNAAVAFNADGGFTLTALAAAPVGECTLTFTVTFTDDTTETHVRTIEVTETRPTFVSGSVGSGSLVITVVYDEPISCATVDDNGSNYQVVITDAEGVTTERTPIGASCANFGGSDTEVDILLGGNPFTSGDTVTVTAVEGGDGNTVVDLAGNAQLVGDSIEISLLASAGEPTFAGGSAAVGENVVTVIYDQPIDCATVDANASNYQVTTTEAAGERATVSAACVAPTDGVDDEVAITVGGDPFVVDETLTVTAVVGGDGDTVANPDADTQPADDSIEIVVA